MPALLRLLLLRELLLFSLSEPEAIDEAGVGELVDRRRGELVRSASVETERVLSLAMITMKPCNKKSYQS